MLIKKVDLKENIVEKPKDGKGLLHRWDYIKEAIPCSELTAFSFIELEPGAQIGNHQHLDNFEVYYFIEGEGKALDNDKEVLVEQGDMLITQKRGNHSLTNIGKGKFKFVAFICS
jgi:oxalate decarboxylase/phosphoglucose isomerase-like protein (cupin superfamily)